MAEEKTPPSRASAAKASNPSGGSSGKGKQGTKNAQPRVGGSAAPGAKSTQPKQITSTDPQKQQAESYNRAMRRRMDHLGTAPNPNRAVEQQRKRAEKKKKRREERQQEVKKVASRGPSRITLGRGTIFFLIGVAAFVILVIALALLINNHIL